jgi:hypothetical protein
MITRSYTKAKNTKNTKAKPRKRTTRPQLDPAQIYTRAEAALTLGISKITLIRARDAGYLAELRAGYRVLHSGEQLLSWLGSGGKTGYYKER